MAAVLTSSIVSDSAQKDGRRWIQELHTDQFNFQWPRFYLCATAFDAAAQLLLNKAQLIIDLQNQEIASNVALVTTIGSLASPTFNYSTALQNFAALRAAYATATQTQAIMGGDFLSSLTDGQLQTAFGMTAGQVTTLRANKLTPAATAAATIRAAAGA